MKVLFLTMWDDPQDGGGGQVTLQHLTTSLLNRGIEPVILSISAKKGLHRADRSGVKIWRAGLRNIYWPSTRGTKPKVIRRLIWHAFDSYNILMQPALRHVLSLENPDVVSVHQINGWSPLGWKTISSLGIPFVNVLHASESLCIGASMYKSGHNCEKQCATCKIFRSSHKVLSKKASAVAGVSNFILNRHLDLGYFKNVPISRVIYNARDPKDLNINSAPKYKEAGFVRVGFIGRLEQNKGIELLLESFSKLKLPNTELWIAGGGEYNYESKLRSTWASKRISFLGRVMQGEFFPSVDFVVAPSLWHEPLGMVVAEAFAFGKPVIGASRGGIPEMIDDGVNGILFDPQYPNELTLALEKMIMDSSFREKLSKNARKSGEKFTNIDFWVEKYINIYETVIKSKR